MAKLKENKVGILIDGNSILDKNIIIPSKITLAYNNELGPNTINMDIFTPRKRKDLYELYLYLKYGGDSQPNCMDIGLYMEKGDKIYERYINEEYNFLDEEIPDKLINFIAAKIGEKAVKLLNTTIKYAEDEYLYEGRLHEYAEIVDRRIA